MAAFNTGLNTAQPAFQQGRNPSTSPLQSSAVVRAANQNPPLQGGGGRTSDPTQGSPAGTGQPGGAPTSQPSTSVPGVGAFSSPLPSYADTMKSLQQQVTNGGGPGVAKDAYGNWNVGPGSQASFAAMQAGVAPGQNNTPTLSDIQDIIGGGGTQQIPSPGAPGRPQPPAQPPAQPARPAQPQTTAQPAAPQRPQPSPQQLQAMNLPQGFNVNAPSNTFGLGTNPAPGFGQPRPNYAPGFGDRPNYAPGFNNAAFGQTSPNPANPAMWLQKPQGSPQAGETQDGFNPSQPGGMPSIGAFGRTGGPQGILMGGTSGFGNSVGPFRGGGMSIGAPGGAFGRG